MFGPWNPSAFPGLPCFPHHPYARMRCQPEDLKTISKHNDFMKRPSVEDAEADHFIKYDAIIQALIIVSATM
jgi:hypothetical protein